MRTTTLPLLIIRKFWVVFPILVIKLFYFRYLIEDQVKGPSSVEGYERALLAGCRCIKVDVHDGLANGEVDGTGPLVYNGNTLTSRIAFAEVLEAIKEHAFTASQ